MLDKFVIYLDYITELRKDAQEKLLIRKDLKARERVRVEIGFVSKIVIFQNLKYYLEKKCKEE